MKGSKMNQVRHRTWLWLVVLGFTLAGAAHADGNVGAGLQKSKLCQTCHGADGRSQVPEAPNLAGQHELYMVEQLRAFKSGLRKNEQMAVIAQMLSPQDMEDIAAYFSAIEITVSKVPGP